LRRTIRKLLKRTIRPVSDILIAASGMGLEQRLLYKAAKFIAADKIAGDYLEFGVFRGDSFILAYNTLEEVFSEEAGQSYYRSPADSADRWAIWQKMRFFAFDSFEGLPELKGIDCLTRDFVPGKFRSSYEVFCQRLRRAEIPARKVGIIPGWFDDTLTEETRLRFGLNKAAIVYIDSDLYYPAKAALNFVTPLLQDGTVIIFDDWYSYRGHPRLGEQRACAEWLEAHPEWTLTHFQKEGPWRNSFIVNLRNISEAERGLAAGGATSSG